MKKKRAAGEGHVRQLPNGRWAAVLSGGYQDGRRIQRWYYGKTQAAVLKKLDNAKGNLRTGQSLAVRRETIAGFLSEWLDSARLRIKPRSHERFSELVRLHIVPALGHVRLDKLTAADVQRLINRKHVAGLAPQTVHHIRGVLRAALNTAIKWKLVHHNVASQVDLPKIERPDIRALSADDARRLLDAARDAKYEGVYALALSTGARRGELLGLRWSDIDFERRLVTFSRSLQRIGGKLTLTDVKTAKSRRTSPLPRFAVMALRAQRARQAELKLAAGNEWREQDLVFTNTHGDPLEPVTLNREFHRVAAKAGLPLMKFHGLRHGAATLMLREETPLKTIQEILGHSSISVTSNFYSHLDAEDEAAGSRRLRPGVGRLPGPALGLKKTTPGAWQRFFSSDGRCNRPKAIIRSTVRRKFR